MRQVRLVVVPLLSLAAVLSPWGSSLVPWGYAAGTVWSRPACGGWAVGLSPLHSPWPLSLTAVHKFQVPRDRLYYWTFKLAKPVNVTQFLITCEIFFHWVHHLWQLKCRGPSHCFRALLVQLKAASSSTGVSVPWYTVWALPYARFCSLSLFTWVKPFLSLYVFSLTW